MSITDLLDEPRRGARTSVEPGRRVPAPLRSPGTRTSRPPISLVPDPPPRAAVAPFVVLVLVVLGVGLVGLLLLNTSLQQGSFLIHDLQTKAAELRERQDELSRRVAVAQAPDTLAKRAKALGMVVNDKPGYLRLDDGTVTGDPEPARRTPATVPELGWPTSQHETPPSAEGGGR